jgi:hypothetical protein
MKDQLAKSFPNGAIGGTLWKTIEHAITVANLAAYAARAAPYVAALLGRTG